MKNALSPNQIRVISEALCIGPEGRRKGYVNRVVVDDAAADLEVCRGLVRRGLMQKRDRMGSEQKSEQVFAVTYEGRVAIRKHYEFASL